MFTVDEERPIPICQADEALERKRVGGARGVRARRDQQPWEAALKSVEEAARSGANLMPRILQAIEASATVGEISDTLRRVFGEHREAVVVLRGGRRFHKEISGGASQPQFLKEQRVGWSPDPKFVCVYELT